MRSVFDGLLNLVGLRIVFVLCSDTREAVAHDVVASERKLDCRAIGGGARRKGIVYELFDRISRPPTLCEPIEPGNVQRNRIVTKMVERAMDDIRSGGRLAKALRRDDVLLALVQ
jgi:hypothetical protein